MVQVDQLNVGKLFKVCLVQFVREGEERDRRGTLSGGHWNGELLVLHLFRWCGGLDPSDVNNVARRIGRVKRQAS